MNLPSSFPGSSAMARSFLKELAKGRRNRKGQNGRVLIIGGSQNYAGAPALAGLAALRCGADLVTIAAPEKVAWAINTYSADLMTCKMKGADFGKKHFPELYTLVETNTVPLIGNGLSQKAQILIKLFIQKIQKPMVLDAGALRVVDIRKLRNCILTPHLDELRSLLENAGYPFTAKELEHIYRSNPHKLLKLIQGIIGSNVLLLKGPIDYIISKNKIVQNRTGNPGMSKGGTGDVLAGLCAGFLAQSGKLFESAVAAAYMNGLAGDILLKRKKGYSFLASDIAEEIKKLS